MAKHKKKQSQHSRQKLADAHRRNEFLYKLNYLITALTGDPAIFRMIPESEYRFLFLIRVQAPRVKFETAGLIRPDIIDQLRRFVLHSLKSTTIPFTGNGPIITIDMFLTIGMSLFTYLISLDDNKFPAAKTFKQALAAVTRNNDEIGDFEIEYVLHTLMSDTIDGLPFLVNFSAESISWVSLDIVIDETTRPAQYFQLKVSSYKPEQKQVVVDGIARPAYEVCWGYRNYGIKKAELTPLQLGLSDDEFPETLPVYIQMHALNKLYERIDCLKYFVLPGCVYNSLADPVYCKGSHHTFLINFMISGLKLGYLVASVQKGILLVQTFLLITNNGTPEGDRLATLTKLNKLDKEYLTIDKLSAFYASDIADTPEVKQLFLDAGCIDLFNVDPKIISDNTLDQKKPLADKIKAYLNYTIAENDMGTYRKEQMPG